MNRKQCELNPKDRNLPKQLSFGLIPVLLGLDHIFSSNYWGFCGSLGVPIGARTDHNTKGKGYYFGAVGFGKTPVDMLSGRPVKSEHVAGDFRIEVMPVGMVESSHAVCSHHLSWPSQPLFETALSEDAALLKVFRANSCALAEMKLCERESPMLEKRSERVLEKFGAMLG